jgi:hypothetical protein
MWSDLYPKLSAADTLILPYPTLDFALSAA